MFSLPSQSNKQVNTLFWACQNDMGFGIRSAVQWSGKGVHCFFSTFLTSKGIRTKQRTILELFYGLALDVFSRQSFTITATATSKSPMLIDFTMVWVEKKFLIDTNYCKICSKETLHVILFCVEVRCDIFLQCIQQVLLLQLNMLKKIASKLQYS